MSKGSTPHVPDDDLDERWLAARSHPQLGQVPHCLDADLAEGANSGDAVPPSVDQETSHPTPELKAVREKEGEDFSL